MSDLVTKYRRGMDPGEEGRILSEGGSYQRSGSPMKAGSNKFDIPAVRLM